MLLWLILDGQQVTHKGELIGQQVTHLDECAGLQVIHLSECLGQQVTPEVAGVDSRVNLGHRRQHQGPLTDTSRASLPI